jgi:DNA-binding CsgD family transcriptional regulator
MSGGPAQPAYQDVVQFDSVAILESLPLLHRQTGQRLYDHVLGLRTPLDLPPMAFVLESELRSAVSDGLQERAQVRGRTRVLTEFRVGAVIPDVLALHYRGSCRAVADLHGLTNLESHVLAAVLSGLTRPAEIAAQLYTRPERVEATLARLQRRGTIRRNARGHFVPQPGSFPLGAAVTAIEAKLHRWRDAIAQAVAYKTFANRAYVAFPRSTLEARVDAIAAMCRTFSLGLISVDVDRLTFVLIAPTRRVRTASWVWAVSKAFSNPTPGTFCSGLRDSTVLSENARTHPAMTADD